MTRILSVIFCLVTLVTPATAQTIHGNPQKVAYASPAEWPVTSCQVHWRAPGVNGMDGMPGHTHLDMQFPVGAELGIEPFTVPFTLTLFDTAGRITDIFGRSGRSLVSAVTLDPGSVWPLQGNPSGAVSVHGHVTFDPSLALGLDYGTPLHGWYPIDLFVRTNYDNHDRVDVSLRLPVFSVIDPSAPEVPPGDGTGITTRCGGDVQDGNGPQIWGSQIIEFRQVLPLMGPLSPDQPWVVQPLGYNYGVNLDTFGRGSFELRLDPDFHNGVPGTIISSTTPTVKSGGAVPLVTLPHLIPMGTHKTMWMWRQTNMDETKELDTLLVFNVTAAASGGAPQPSNNVPLTLPASPSTEGPSGDGGPTPTCQDPTATNIGQPLPCTFPQPQPTWLNFTPTFQRLLDQVRLCAPDGKCLILGSVVP